MGDDHDQNKEQGEGVCANRRFGHGSILEPRTDSPCRALGQKAEEALPGHVNLVLEEDVIKSSLQVCLVGNVALVVA